MAIVPFCLKCPMAMNRIQDNKKMKMKLKNLFQCYQTNGNGKKCHNLGNREITCRHSKDQVLVGDIWGDKTHHHMSSYLPWKKRWRYLSVEQNTVFLIFLPRKAENVVSLNLTQKNIFKKYVCPTNGMGSRSDAKENWFTMSPKCKWRSKNIV